MWKWIGLVVVVGLAALHASNVHQWQRPSLMPVPKDNPATPEKIALGKLLFFDPRLSKNDSVSCASCHNPYLAWTDGQSKAIGLEKGRRNTPTLVNVAYQSRFFWDGRAGSLEEQALGPMQAKEEMGLSPDEVVGKLKKIKGYLPLFDAAFPKEGVTKETVAKAIAAFERTIVSEEASFDAWIAGKKNAISQNAVEGFSLFVGKGKCAKCHSGFNFTLENFENIGLGDGDTGAYETTGQQIWLGAFKTPTLREVVKTAPYFHDGSVHTIEEAVHICGNGGRYKDVPRSPFFRDRGITRGEMGKIVDFLETLSTHNRFIDFPHDFPR